MATTTRGYPLFTGGQVPAGPAQMQQLAEAIDADVASFRGDSGWISGAIPLGTGWTAAAASGWNALTHRIQGGWVTVNGSITYAGSWPVGTVVGYMPVGARPSRLVDSAGMAISAAGAISLRTAGSTAAGVHLVYPLG